MASEMPNLTHFAPTLLASMGIRPPAHMTPAYQPIVDGIRALAGGPIDKAAVFHADAVPGYVLLRHLELAEPMKRLSRLEAPFRAVMPSITPVCFGAMYSGTYPDRNGVPRYVPPVLKPDCIQPRITCETVIEALVRAGKRTAVVTCSNGCIASMLYGRGAQMFIIDGDDDDAMFRCAMEAVRSDDFDVVFLYQLSYDATMHRCGPESAEALDVLATLGRRYEQFAREAAATWKDRRLLTVFNSDHGAHRVEGRPGHAGSHGEDIPEDMEMRWYFGVWGSQGAADPRRSPFAGLHPGLTGMC